VFIFPLRQGTYASDWRGPGTDFGQRLDPNDLSKIDQHGGIDIPVNAGTAVVSVGPGVVSKIKFDHPQAGTYVNIEHDNGMYSRYLHLENVLVSDGQRVHTGQVIGKSGGIRGAYGSGNSTGSHLHFELWHGKPYVGGERVNPLDYLGEKKGIPGGILILAGLLAAGIYYQKIL